MAVTSDALNLLKEYHFFDDSSFEQKRFNRSYNVTLLAVWKKEGEERLVEVKQADLTMRNHFWSLMYTGPLAYLYYTLEDLRDYLLQFDWKVIGRTIDRRILVNTRKIAGRLLVYKKDPSLWEKVSAPVRTDHGMFPLNPECNGRIFRTLVECKLRSRCEGAIIPDFSILPKNSKEVFRGATPMRYAAEVNRWILQFNPSS